MTFSAGGYDHAKLSLQGFQHRLTLHCAHVYTSDTTEADNRYKRRSDTTQQTNGLVSHDGRRAVNVESLNFSPANLLENPTLGVLGITRASFLAMRDQAETRLVHHQARDCELQLLRWPKSCSLLFAFMFDVLLLCCFACTIHGQHHESCCARPGQCRTSYP